jgi:plasmid stability protein
MCSTCEYHFRMASMIQVRNVPDEIHRTLKARAALEGRTLSDYLGEELRRLAARPSLEELRQRLTLRTGVRPHASPAKVLREERGRR